MFLLCLITNPETTAPTVDINDLPPPPQEWIDALTDQTKEKTFNKDPHVKSCPDCDQDIMRAAKSCECGWKYKSKDESTYNPFTTRPRNKKQWKIYTNAGSPLGPQKKILNVKKDTTFQRRLDEHPEQGLLIKDNEGHKELFCSFCECNIISSKVNVKNHINTKKHAVNKKRSLCQ